MIVQFYSPSSLNFKAAQKEDCSEQKVGASNWYGAVERVLHHYTARLIAPSTVHLQPRIYNLVKNATQLEGEKRQKEMQSINRTSGREAHCDVKQVNVVLPVKAPFPGLSRCCAVIFRPRLTL